MPYTLTVLTLIVIGVGFTLFQTAPSSEPEIDVVTTAVNETEAEVNGDEVAVAETEEYIVSSEAKETPQEPSDSSPVPVEATTYRNGLYSTEVNYRTPAGMYKMDVSLTLSNDTITNSNISFDTAASKSDYSGDFAGGYENEVIGKDLDTVDLSRVGGASLTSKAFNSAIATIKTKAS